MKMRLQFLSICAFVLFTAAAAYAQNSEITLYAGGFRGDSFITQPSVLFPEVEAVFDDEFTGGVRYAYFFTPLIAVEVGAGFTPASLLAETSFSDGLTKGSSIVDIDTWVMHANLTAHLVRARVIPFLTGGVGAVHFNIKTSRFGFLTPSETDLAWNAGGGLKIPVRGNTALRFDGRVYFLDTEFSKDDTATFTEITGGVSILFDF
jgi:opacity protein-like surface antigen